MSDCAPTWLQYCDSNEDPTLTLGQITLPMGSASQWQQSASTTGSGHEHISDIPTTGWSTGEEPPANASRQMKVQGELGNYSSQSLLGSGGMGDVYLAIEDWLQRPVALKVLNPDSRKEGARQALWHEAQLAARLDHPAIVPIHDGGDGFVVMRHIQGSSWAKVLAGQPSSQLSVDVERLIVCCEALASAHARGVVHRDIKPANIMIGDKGQVLVLDWGLAITGGWDDSGIWHNDDLDQRRACAGTPQWVSPEAARGEADLVGPTSDVWGLGAILWFFLSGQPINNAKTSNQALRLAARAQRLSPKRLPANTPSGLIPILVNSLDPDSSKRPSAAELGQSLQRWLQRSDSEGRAGERRRLAAELLTDRNDSQENGAQALRLLQEAAELDPQLDTSLLQAEAHWRVAQSALQQGDVLPAQAALAALTSNSPLHPRIHTVIGDLQRQLEDRQDQQQHSTRLQRRLRLGAVAGLAATVGIIIWLVGMAATMPERDHQRREVQARDLLQALPKDESTSARQQRLRGAMQAAALAPHIHDGPIIAAQAAADLALAAAADNEHMAAARQQELVAWLIERYPSAPFSDDLRHGLTLELDNLRTLQQAQRQGELDRRRSVLKDARSASGSLRTLSHRAEEIASWDGEELWPDILELSEGDVPSRLLLARVLGLRPDMPGEEHLHSLLQERHPALEEEVLLALSQRQQTESASHVRDFFLSAGDDLYEQPKQRIQVLRYATWIDGTGLDLADGLRWAWVQGNAEAYGKALSQTENASAAYYRRGALLAWGFSGDLQQAHKWAQTALEADPQNAESIALMVELLTQQQDWQAAQSILEAAAQADLDSTLLAPWRMWLSLRLGNPTVDQAALPNLAELPTFAHGRLARLRRALKHDEAEIAQWKLPHADLIRTIDQEQDAQLRRRLSAHLFTLVWGNQPAEQRLVQSLWSLGHQQGAQRFIDRALFDDPDNASLYAIISDLLFSERNAAEAYDAIQQAYTRARLPDIKRQTRSQFLRLARITGDDVTFYGNIAEDSHFFQGNYYFQDLASNPAATVLRRALTEDGQVHQVLSILHTRGMRNPAFSRHGLDDILLSIPAMRAHGWPGCEGEVLAERCLFQAILLIEDNRLEEAHTWLALVRKHDQQQLLAPITTVIEALSPGQQQDAQRALQALEQDDGQLILLPWVRNRFRQWQAWAAQDSDTLRPAMRLERPLEDIVLSAQDLEELQQYYSEYIGRLPPPRRWWSPPPGDYQPDLHALDHLRADPAAPARLSLQQLAEQQ